MCTGGWLSKQIILFTGGEILSNLKGEDILTYTCNTDNIKGMMSSEIMMQKAERMGRVTRRGLGQLICGNVLEFTEGLSPRVIFAQWVPTVTTIYFISFQNCYVKTPKNAICLRSWICHDPDLITHGVLTSTSPPYSMNM